MRKESRKGNSVRNRGRNRGRNLRLEDGTEEEIEQLNRGMEMKEKKEGILEEVEE